MPHHTSDYFSYKAKSQEIKGGKHLKANQHKALWQTLLLQFGDRELPQLVDIIVDVDYCKPLTPTYVL